jgi:hypothetical protein
MPVQRVSADIPNVLLLKVDVEILMIGGVANEIGHCIFLSDGQQFRSDFEPRLIDSSPEGTKGLLVPRR